jgi:hypothetical protein
VAQHRLEPRALVPYAGMPLGHVARLRRVELEAEAEADLSILRQHPRDERLLARLQAHGVHMDES